MHTREGVADSLLKDMKEITAKLLANPDDPSEGMGVIYGMAQRLPDRSLVADIACSFLDGLYTTDFDFVNGTS